ncbi:choice-of-anchor J domain-containing protein [Flavobacterium sp.]|uniref:T9SS type A sorting domain-containing protein n=1 Tax=Flavobacterium sp. TaxID=239 RepID=UPI0035AE0430
MKKITFLIFSLLVSFSGFAQFPESFEGATFPPTGWASYIGENGLGTVENWGINTDVFNSGAQSAVVFYESGTGGINEDWLVTPAVTITAPNTSLSFFQRQAYTADYGTEYTIRVSTSSQTDISTFTTVNTQSESDITTTFSQKLVDLSAYTGQTIYIAFVMSQDDGDVWAIDDVDFQPSVEAPTCASNPTPADMATEVPIGAITLSWDAPTTGGAPTEYDLYAGDTADTVTNLVGTYTDTNTGTDLTINNFNTTIYWKIVPKNAGGEATGCPVWSFTTATPPGYCLNAPNGQWPTSTYVPETCDGLFVNEIAANCYAGEYSVVTVTAGQTYTFSSWNDTSIDFITISTDEGVTAAAYGTSPLTWVSTVDGDIRFYSHIDNQCGDEAVNRTRAIVCGLPSSDSPDYANLQWPPSATITQGGSVDVYGQVYEGGLTDVDPNIVGQAPGINVWIGISPEGSNTNPNTWTSWTPMSWNAAHVSNNDEYMAAIGATLTPGTYYYATRYSLNGGAYVYGGIDASNNGNFWDGTTYLSGVLTVQAPAAPANDACSTATAVTLPHDSTMNALGATNNDGFITACPAGMNDGVWYSFVGDGGDITVDVSEVTGAFDPELGVYTGACGALVCEGNADNGFEDEGETVVVTGSVVGTTYYVNVGNYSAFTDFPEGAFRIQITSSLGNNSFDNASFVAIPNPVKNFLNLSYVNNIDNVEVFNLLGQKVSSTKLNTTQGQIDMSNLTNGVYLVKVTSNNQVKAIKVIKE